MDGSRCWLDLISIGICFVYTKEFDLNYTTLTKLEFLASRK